jgi:O-antigen/teichoic acid export membrane protein
MATGFGQVVTTATQIAGVPVYLYCWGAERYGEWLVLSTIPAYLALSDFGFANVAANEMAMNVANGRRPDALRVFQSTFCVILGALAVAALLSLGLMGLQGALNILSIKTISLAETFAGIGLFCVYVFAGQIIGLLNAGYRCEGLFARGMLLSNIGRLIEFGFCLLSVVLTSNIAVAAASMLLARALLLVWMRVDIAKRIPWLHFGFSQASRQQIRLLVKPSLAFMAFPIGNALIFQGLTMLVGSLLGGAAVALFATTRTLTRIPTQIVGMVNASTWPEISAAYGAGNLQLTRRLHAAACQASVFVTILVSCGLLVAGQALYRWWTHNQLPFDAHLLTALLVATFMNSLWTTSSVLPAAINRHQSMAMVYLPSTVVTFGLAAALVLQLGLTGAAYALLILEIAMTLVVFKMSAKLLDEPILALIRDLSRIDSIKAIWHHK